MTLAPAERIFPAQPMAADDLRTLFGQSIAVFAALAGPGHVVQTANPAFFAAIGQNPGPNRGAAGRADARTGRAGFLELLDQVCRTGEPYTGHDAHVRLGTGAQARDAYFDFTHEPRLAADGTVTGIRVIGVKTTQTKDAQRLLTKHRAQPLG